MIRESVGTAGPLPAVRLEGLRSGLEAGITTGERNFRHRARGSDPAVDRSYAELDAYAREFGGWVRVDQVHGARVIGVGRGVGTVGEADGLVLRGRHPATQPGLLTVTVADCVPVFLVWPGGYGLLHAGWRGVAAGVLEAGFAATSAPPGSVRVHFGPAIGGCCYEVGAEVMAALFRDSAERRFAESAGLAPGAADRWMLDLRAALTRRALVLGADPANVTTSRRCTCCDPLLHSFRRSGKAVADELMLAFMGERRDGSGAAA